VQLASAGTNEISYQILNKSQIDPPRVTKKKLLGLSPLTCNDEIQVEIKRKVSHSTIIAKCCFLHRLITRIPKLNILPDDFMHPLKTEPNPSQ
jgi:hypothetical protein